MLNANDVLARDAKSRDPSQIDIATAWLARTLAAGPKLANSVKAAAIAAGIASRTLDRAKKRLGVVASKAGFQGSSSWTLPEELNEHQVQKLAHIDELGAHCKNADEIADAPSVLRLPTRLAQVTQAP